jgi:hypothetical protein
MGTAVKPLDGGALTLGWKHSPVRGLTGGAAAAAPPSLAPALLFSRSRLVRPGNGTKCSRVTGQVWADDFDRLIHTGDRRMVINE